MNAHSLPLDSDSHLSLFNLTSKVVAIILPLDPRRQTPIAYEIQVRALNLVCTLVQPIFL